MDTAAVVSVIESVIGRPLASSSSAPLYEQIDSIEIVELFPALETVFGITIDENLVEPGDLATVESLVQLLTRLANAQNRRP